MVTTALRRQATAPHSSCLEVIVHEHSDITKVKGTLTGRASVSLQEVRLDLSDFFRVSKPFKKLRKLFRALGDLPHLKTLRFQYASTATTTTTTDSAANNHHQTLQRLPVQLLTIAMSQASGRLETLELSHVNLTGGLEEFHDFAALLRHHPSLRVFSFSSSGCSSAFSISQLLTALSKTPQLEKVIIYSEGRSPWGRLEAEAVGALCRSPTIFEFQHLVLYDSSSALGMENFFTDEHTVAMAQALSSVSVTNTTLQHITNTNNDGNHDQQQQLQSTNASQQLEELLISCWPLGSKGILALSQMLRVNTRLKKLTIVIYELEECQDHGCIAVDLVEALKFNNTLEVLELHGRKNEAQWIEPAIVEMLQVNYALQRIKLFNEDSFLQVDIDFYLQLNQAGRGRLLRNANAPKVQWVEALANVRHDISCLYYFLSTNPMLLEKQ